MVGAVGANEPASHKAAWAILKGMGWTWSVLAFVIALAVLAAGSPVAGASFAISGLCALPSLWQRWRGTSIGVLLGIIRYVIGVGVIITGVMPTPVDQTPVHKASPVSSLRASDAIDLCRPELKKRLSHPSTAEFDWITGSDFKLDGMKSALTVRLSAKNTFGLEMRMVGACTFLNDQITDVYVGEDMR